VNVLGNALATLAIGKLEGAVDTKVLESGLRQEIAAR